MELIKRISGISFAIAFIMGIVIFTGYGRSIIPYSIAQLLFIAFGAIGLVSNLITFQQGKHAPMYSLAFWISSLILFGGFIFKLMHWPYSEYILIAGMILLGLTFIIPSQRSDEVSENDDLLDQ